MTSASTTTLRSFLLALGLSVLASTASAASGRALRRGQDRSGKLQDVPSRALGLNAMNPLRCILRGKLSVGESLGKGEGVCAGNTELASHEFGLTPDGQIVLWHHDYRTDVETVVWQDPSGLAGDTLRFEEDGTVVLYDEGVSLCALGEPIPGVQNPRLVVSARGDVSVRAANGGDNLLWTLDAATSACQ